MDNFAYKYGERYDEVVEEYLAYKLELIEELMSVEWIIFGVACAVLAIIAIFFIRPSISMVFYEFDLVTYRLFQLLIIIPRRPLPRSWACRKHLLKNITAS